MSSSSSQSLQEITVLVAGAVDSSKSTTIGVLINGELDTKTNPMAKRVDKHEHEKESKHTSSISNHYMRRGDKVVNLVNLCGHLKYLKSTLHGITSQFADYCLLIVNVNAGLTEMSLEHLNIIVHLNIPFCIVLTKLDILSDTVRGMGDKNLEEQTAAMKEMYIQVHTKIHNDLRKFSLKAVSLKADADYNLTESFLPYADYLGQRTNLVPIICTSNRTGKNIDKLRDFIFSLKSRPLWNPSEIINNVFFVTTVYKVDHVGLVLSGVVKSKIPIKVTETWHLGPYEGRFIPVKIKSIHNDVREDVDELSNGESGCLCINFPGKEKLKREQIRKGMIITNDPVKIMPYICQEFSARIMILQHHSTVRGLFESVVHMGPIRQSTTITLPAGVELLRTGDIAIVKFKWKFTPEFVETGTRFFAREASCRIAGEVLNLTTRETVEDVTESVEAMAVKDKMDKE